MSQQNNEHVSSIHDTKLQRLKTLRQEVAQLEHELAINATQHFGSVVLSSFEEQLKEITDYIPAVIYMKDLAGRYVLINREFEKFSGLSSQDILGRTSQELFIPELANAFADGDSVAISSDSLIEHEWNVFNSSTQHHESYLTLVFPLHDINGQIFATYGTITNITTRKQAEASIRTNQELMQAILDNAPAVFYIKDTDGRYTLINRLFETRFGMQRRDVIGKTDYDLFSKEEADHFCQGDIKVFETGQAQEFEWIKGSLTYSTFSFPLRNKHEQIYAVCGISIDISSRKLAEAVQHQALVQEEIIRAQELTLAELTTPLLAISDQAVVMPLIGAMDSRRVQDIIVTLLEGVARQRAQVAILDITGVAVVDTQVANALVQAAQAVQLLGAQVIITGIRPEIAQTLVNLGVNLRNIVTLNSLQNGISYALRRSKN